MAGRPTTLDMGEPTPAAADTTSSPAGPSPQPGLDAGEAVEPLLSAGDAVARYRIDGVVGRGGMGVVYRARDPELDRVLAIKLVRSRQRGGDRMLREAQAMARLDHPNVVPIFDVGMRDQQMFLVMPFLAGGTLGDWCRAEARPWQEVVRRYIAAGRGLEAAHRAGIVHRDFKPDNVLVTAKGDVQVADFGLARASRDDSGDAVLEGAAASDQLDRTLTRAGQVLGTPAYMAPEQLDGEPVDARADQFSFCIALYEGLYGVRPFDVPAGAGIPALRAAIGAEKIRLAPADRTVPKSVHEVVLRGLRHAPGLRWPSMSALLDHLEGLVGKPRQSWLPYAAAAATTAIAAGALWIALGGKGDGAGDRRPTAGTASAAAAVADDVSDKPYTTRPITFRGDIEIDRSRISPDGTMVAMIAGGDVHVLPTAGGDIRTIARNVTSNRADRSLSWSPDGRHVMLANVQTPERSIVDIVEVATGAVEHRELELGTLAALTAPREVASARSNSHEVLFTSLDGDQPSRRCAIPGQYTWIKDVMFAGGGLFVTVRHEDQSITVFRTDRQCAPPVAIVDHVQTDHAVVDSDGSHVGVPRYTDGADWFERTPVERGAPVLRSRPIGDDIQRIVGVAADGKLLALTRTWNWRFVRISGNPATVTETIGAGTFYQEHAFSPDGTRVAIVDDRDHVGPELRVVGIDQLEARPPALLADALHTSWSPDGGRIAALVRRTENTYEIAIVSAKTAEDAPHRIPVTDVGLVEAPVWLDDRRIAYQRSDNKTYVAVDLETLAKELLYPPELGWTFRLAVNPLDGAHALVWNRRSGKGVYVARPGEEPTRVMAVDKQQPNPVWSPDGKTLWIYDSAGIIERFDVALRNRTRYFSLEGGDDTRLSRVMPVDATTVLAKLDRPITDLVVLE